VGVHFLDFQNAYMLYSRGLLLAALSKNLQSVNPGSYPVGRRNIPPSLKKVGGGELLKNFGKELPLFINLHGISELLLLVTV
jgi:hypothetical protein